MCYLFGVNYTEHLYAFELLYSQIKIKWIIKKIKLKKGRPLKKNSYGHFLTAIKAFKTPRELHHRLTALRAFNTEKKTPLLSYDP